jgi:tetratricopeptide (TPR) repeat protein
MKYALASVTLCVLLVVSSCSQSPEKLLATGNKYHANKKYDEASILYQKVLVKDKTNAEAYYRLGLNLLDQGKIGEAAQALRRAVDLKPANTDALIKLAEIYLTAYVNDPKRYKNIQSDINDLDAKILQQNPSSFEGLRIQGLVAYANRDLPKALEIFAKADQVQPHSRELVNWYAQALQQAGKTDQGIALVNETLAHDKTWGPGYDFLFMVYGRAGERDKAEAVLRQRATDDPTSAMALENYANYRLASGDFAGAEQVMLRVLNDPKSFPNGRMMLGDFYAHAKKPDQALAAYQRGEKDDPKNLVKYQERMVALEAATNHGDQALKMAKDLADKNPKDASPSEIYALLLLQTGTRASGPKTVDEIKRLVDNLPANTALRLDLARAYFGSNDNAKALAAAQQAVTDEQKSGHARTAIVLPAQTLVAMIYSQRGEHAQALDEAALVLNARPGDPDATIIKDRALVATGQADKALPDLEALTQRFPSMSEARILLGNVYLDQHQFDKAAGQFEALSKTAPSDSRGVIGLLTVKLYSGHSAEAIQGLRDLLQKNPNDAAIRFELANFQVTAAGLPNSNPAAAKDLLGQAAGNYKQILKTNSGAADLWLRLGVVQRTLEQNDAALGSFEQAVNTDPKNRDALLNQALLLDRMQRKKEAINVYNKVLNLDPDNALVLNNLAFAAAESGSNLDQAQTYAERAKKKAPNSPAVDDTLGYVYLQKNLNTQAVEIFRQNVREHPNNAAYRFHLAMALFKQGDKQGAKDQASKALQGADPDLQNQIKTFVGKIG